MCTLQLTTCPFSTCSLEDLSNGCWPVCKQNWKATLSCFMLLMVLLHSTRDPEGCSYVLIHCKQRALWLCFSSVALDRKQNVRYDMMGHNVKQSKDSVKSSEFHRSLLHPWMKEVFQSNDENNTSDDTESFLHLVSAVSNTMTLEIPFVPHHHVSILTAKSRL